MTALRALITFYLVNVLALHGNQLATAFSVVYSGQCRTRSVAPAIILKEAVAKWPSSRKSKNCICLSESTNDFVEAENLTGIQTLFNKYCDNDGLMNKESLEGIPIFATMLSEGDLLPEELTSIWKRAQKFPGVDSSDERIDVDSFVQIYRDVDDLFEDEDQDSATTPPETITESVVENPTVTADGTDDQDEAELEEIFASICDKDNLISKESLKAWDEIQKLIDDGLLAENEFEDIWNQTPKSPGSSAQLDVYGFLSFNVAIDGLFEFEDEDEDEPEPDDLQDPANSKMGTKQPKLVEGDDLPPDVLFASIANEDYLVGMEEMKSWGSLQEMLADGDLLPTELEKMFEGIEKAPGTDDKLTQAGFIKLYNEIDSLFEDEDENPQPASQEPDSADQPVMSQAKKDLLDLLDDIAMDAQDFGSLPCGLDCTETEQKAVLSIVNALEKQPTNMVLRKQGNIELTDLEGTWELLYSSSSAMKFNQGLSGLGGSFPNGKFGGLKQKLVASKYLTDVEYIEHIEVNPTAASFDVTVTGSWDLRTSVSLFTGAPSIVLNVVPQMVTYGPTSTRGDHWKSLGPMNMLDLSYVDEDIRVMRGCTSSETLFIFKRSL